MVSDSGEHSLQMD